jgi:hypothetical protein
MGQNNVDAKGSLLRYILLPLVNQSRNLTQEEASIFANKNLLVSVDWHLPSSWHIS